VVTILQCGDVGLCIPGQARTNSAITATGQRGATPAAERSTTSRHARIAKGFMGQLSALTPRRGSGRLR